ncbi:uncharacterized protein EV154DRAFT_487853 [Mucor mucedo]|uniref:uncharacterized protein n=1 Tax=Mucor mucedo TaxID=29922 RepID=UPI00221E408E|nr:uncharacterized protein EV154DRAFT_487853 [Mucor mucedo]KAI7870093.1 hypothetical protein EV154DRAFT_487853 [Mucor mucedo]
MSRLRKSKDTCEEIKKLYEARANIEQDYGERLLKLAQHSRVGEFEEDTFAETLLRIPSTLEATARAHIDLAQQLKDHLEAPLDGFLKDQRDIRKMQQQYLENSRQLKNLHEADVARARDYYSIECEKLNSMLKSYSLLSIDGSNDDLTKIEKEIDEQRRMVTVADQVYRRSVDNYNSVIEKWVHDWTSSADKFQEMEVKRISYLRSTLWSFSNMMTSTFSIDEECCDRIRTALEITDVQKDITSFVSRYGTGTRIPAPLSYEVLHNNTTQTKSVVPEVVPTTPIPSAANTAATIHYVDHQPLSAPTKKTSLESLPESVRRGASESNATVKSIPVTILTNPDEELKSVDRQLQRLEVHNASSPPSEDERNSLMQTSPQHYTLDEKRGNKVEQPTPMSAQPLSGVTNTTDQSYGPVSTAIKEVEQILNIRGFSSSDDIASPTPVMNTHENIVPITKNVVSNRTSYANNTQTIPPIMTARSITSENAGVSPHHPSGEHTDDFSSGIYDALGLNGNQHTSQYDLNNHKELYSPSAVNLSPILSSSTPIASAELLSNHSNISAESNNYKKYKPMPNPIYTNNNLNISPIGNTEKEIISPESVPNQRPAFSTRTSSLLLSPKQDLSENNNKSPLNLHVTNNNDDDEEEDAEDKAYHDRMPRPPPKDEKWVISSIRRPQQLPVRALNAKMFDGTASISRNSVMGHIDHDNPARPESAPPTATATAAAAAAVVGENRLETMHQPKVHRPAIPLTIDIPNSVKPTPELPQTIAQQAIAEGRRLSQMSPIQQKMDLNNTVAYNQQPLDRNAMRGYLVQNGLEDGGIRPAPWQEEMPTDDRMASKNGNFRGTPAVGGAPGEYYMNGGGGTPMPRVSSLKIANQEYQQQQQQVEEENKKRFAKNNTKQYSESSMKSKEKDNKAGRFSLGFFTGNKKEKKKEKEAAAAAAAAAMTAANIPIPSQTPAPQPFDGSRYIGYAKAQWPFEATIDGEMSFHAEEVIGILGKQSDGWWAAERIDPAFAGQRGLVPGNYMVETIHP